MYLLLLLLVVATEYGYHLEHAGPAQSWLLYVMRGVLLTYVFTLLWQLRRSNISRFGMLCLAAACSIGAFEEAQNAVCGVADWKDPAYVGALCLYVFGPRLYFLIASTAITAVVILLDRRSR